MCRFYYSIYGPHIEQYLDIQKSLGYKSGQRHSILVAFDKLAMKRDEAIVGISKEFAEEWGKKDVNESEVNRYKRIQGARLFASFLCNSGYPSYIARLPKFQRTFTPYIFTKEQIQAFFDVCDHLDTWSAGRPTVFVIPTLFRLLYATGLRISEALALTCRDINLKDGYLIIRNTKNGMDRAVPISDTLIKVCCKYFECRTRYAKLNCGSQDRFFILPDGRGCNICTIYNWFRIVLHKTGISHGGRGMGPRLHDLRHTFACHSLVHMTNSGLDMYYSLPILSTYLGHQSLAATDGYVRLTAAMYPDIAEKINTLAPNLFPNTSNPNEHESN
jgi:integrase